MKILRGISLYVACPLLLLGIGFLAGLESSRFMGREEGEGLGIVLPLGLPSQTTAGQERLAGEPEEENVTAAGDKAALEGQVQDDAEAGEEELEEVASSFETLCVDTAYVLKETDVLHHTAVETTQRLPNKYVGMNREQFLEAMELYEAFPPLSEMERGFVSLEVLSFSRERVVVQMNYRYVQPSESFYLAVFNNKVVVYLEDRKTVYIETEIELDSLPEQLQRDVIQMMWIENEEKLYNFLENYSS